MRNFAVTKVLEMYYHNPCLERSEKKGSGTVAGTARRVLRTTVPDPFFSERS